MAHLILVRHSSTEASGTGRNLGQQSDPPLTAGGVELAGRLGEALRGELLEVPTGELRAITSPARRCRQTLEACLRTMGTTPSQQTEKEGLLEIDYGAWEGLTSAECRARDPQLRAAWEADPYDTRAPHGESGADVAARAFPVIEAVERWLRAGTQRVALVVAHNHVNRLWLTTQIGWPMARYRDRIAQDPAGYSIIGLGKGRAPLVRRLNIRPA
jgi:broad specificity phosphatase PhoE